MISPVGKPGPAWRRVAAVDCGTNTLRLLVADVRRTDQEVDLREVRREMRVVRLGEGVDRTGRLSPEALRRTETALHEYAALIAADGVTSVRMVATSATRDADNPAELTTVVRRSLGVEPDVVTGEEEAALSFAGAIRGLSPDRPSLVLDIGGGSTELVRGTHAVERAVSVDVGCVRLTERHLDAAPPSAASLAGARTDLLAGLAGPLASLDAPPRSRLVGVAGTVTTLVAMTLGLAAYDRDAIHHTTVPATRLRATIDRVLRSDRAALAAEPTMHPGRVDVIAAGALILATVLDRLGSSELTASETDILDGIALTLA